MSLEAKLQNLAQMADTSEDLDLVLKRQQNHQLKKLVKKGGDHKFNKPRNNKKTRNMQNQMYYNPQNKKLQHKSTNNLRSETEDIDDEASSQAINNTFDLGINDKPKRNEKTKLEYKLKSEGGQSQEKFPMIYKPRRIHENGTQMLERHYVLRDTQNQHAMMERRLNRLMIEDENAKKSKQKAEIQQQKLLDARFRHYQDMMAKIKHNSDRSAVVQMLRIKNQLDKMKRSQGIANGKQKLQFDKQQSRQALVDQATYMYQSNRKIREQQLEEKRNLYQSVSRHKSDFKQFKKQNSENQLMLSKNKYTQKIQHKENITEQMKLKIAEMEAKEISLVDNLQATLNDQKRAHSSLQAMVSGGIDYYKNCYNLKKNDKLDHQSLRQQMQASKIEKIAELQLPEKQHFSPNASPKSSMFNSITKSEIKLDMLERQINNRPNDIPKKKHKVRNEIRAHEELFQ